jgi:hypothetical protein
MTQPVLGRRRKHCVILATGFLMSGVLLTAPSALSQDVRGDPRAALRNDREYARLYYDGVAFLALPEAKQEAMRKLHKDLQSLPPAERDRLKDVLARYADWLDRLPATVRQAVLNAPDSRTRLDIIKKRREKEWIARQAKPLRQYLDKLPSSRPAPAVAAAGTVGMLFGAPQQMRPLAFAGAMVAETTDLRADTISRLKREESRKARNWMIAARHWVDLTDPKKTMPARAADFNTANTDIETFVKEFLLPALDKGELARLDKAGGQWPLYPMTLVELADKHPMALPQKRGPTTFKDLPADVQKRLMGKMFLNKEGKKKDFDAFFQKLEYSKDLEQRLAAVLPKQSLTRATKFAAAVATYVHTKKLGVKLPNELWAAKAKDMSVPMKVFLDQKGPFWTQLTPEEHALLIQAENKWPEYPLKVQELTNKYGFRPPWQALPDIDNKGGDIWDKYRIKPYSKSETPLPAVQR